MKRALFAVAVMIGALLAAEGALSLLDQPRFADRLRGTPHDDAARRDAAPRPPTPRAEPVDPEAPDDVAGGLYLLHEDPRVRYRFKRNVELELQGARFRTTALGFRKRPGGKPPQPRTDLLVLGDSVAFGYGLDDADTFAARLEALLAPLAGDDAPPVVAQTLAVPGWNHRQAVAALHDHWPAYQPDVVVYLPISNDLGTASEPFGHGRLRLAPDPNEPDPFLLVSRSHDGRVERGLRGRAASPATAALLAELGVSVDPALPPGRALGPSATEADLSPESRRRFDANAASILELRAFLAARGGELLVFLNGDSRYSAHLARRLLARAPDLALLFGQRGTTPEMQLVDDPHPNADTVAARAGWIAEALVERGWIPRAPGAEWTPPETPPAYAELRFDLRDGPGVAARAASFREQDLAALRSEIVVPASLGLRQVFGGLNADGSARLHTRLLLRADGDTLRIQTAALADRPDAAPVRVAVHVDGAPLGEFEVPRKGLGDARLPLPESVRRGRPVEVLLVPERWAIARPDGFDEVAAYMLHRVAIE